MIKCVYCERTIETKNDKDMAIAGWFKIYGAWECPKCHAKMRKYRTKDRRIA